jgi:hypothetical protein
MRITAFCGCMVTAIDCAQAARNGGKMFSDGSSWLYWIFAGIWIVAGFHILFYGTEA